MGIAEDNRAVTALRNHHVNAILIKEWIGLVKSLFDQIKGGADLEIGIVSKG